MIAGGGEGTMGKGIVLMAVYSAGFSTLMMILGLGIVQSGKLPKAGQWMVTLHKVSSVVLMLAGVFYMLKGSGTLDSL
jgi:cytochrome c biogenesis protein CcdA